MTELFTAFFTSYLISLLIVRYAHLHGHLTNDHDLAGPQKNHSHPVPRIGGLAILCGLILGSIALSIIKPNYAQLVHKFLICALPTYVIGTIEDVMKSIGVRIRLTLTAISAGLIIYLTAGQITRLDIPMVDSLFLIPFFGLALTIFAITGLANAYNIIDGFNGLASMVGIITILGIIYVAFQVNDHQLIALGLIMIGAILGFFFWNYPKGLLFLGDGGAYLIGFWIASLSVLIVSRHNQISPWFALAVNGYPIMETLFTIYRRWIHKKKNPASADGIHFHTLIYRRLVNKDAKVNPGIANARTAPYLWVLTGFSTAPALLWWNNTFMLMTFFGLFVTLYIWLYKKIIGFKVPNWLSQQ